MIQQISLYCELDYPYESNSCFIVDRYQNKRKKLELQNGINTLPILESGLFYKDSLGNIFLVYKSDSTLSFELAKKCFDFRELDVFFLDYFCATLNYHENTTSKDKKLIDSFFECFNYNIYPNRFIELQKELLNET